MLPPNFTVTDEYKKVVELCRNPGSTILISGKAGTGKSVLVDYLTEVFKELNVIKVAPTGVAAINVDGATIHSTFKLPTHIMSSAAIKSHCQQLAITPASKNMMSSFCKSIHILIIDEISMVRADILDAIDQVLRKFTGRNLPFGGIVIVMVGDLLQLSPIVNKQDEDEFKACGYDTPYFFSSHVMQTLLDTRKLMCILLSQVRRQNDPIFLTMLNNIRNSENIGVTMKVLNQLCYQPDAEMDRNTITLCMTNHLAGEINDTQLERIDAPVTTYYGRLDGNFRRDSVLSPDELHLKLGARVMFTKNHPERLWVNGTLGTVTGFLNNLPLVTIDGDSEPMNVDYMTWENAKYVINKNANTYDDDTVPPITKQVLGSFTQIPLMLAWSVTTHKSQGLTFDNVNINLGRGAFTAGQLYVAFSRCRTIEGIRLEVPIKQSDFITDRRVVSFYDSLDYFIINKTEESAED